jgi:hypothetical protein
MTHQFRPPHHNRLSHPRYSQEFVSPTSSFHQLHWRMQQSLYMGSSTPTFHREASLSPQTPHTVSNFGNTSPTYQDQPNNTSSPSSGRVMHPSSAYNYGNPGYYYDPMQFPVSHETQTSPHSYTLHKDTYIPVPQTSPTVNVNTSDTPPSHFANFTTNPSVTLNTIPFGEYQSFYLCP